MDYTIHLHSRPRRPDSEMRQKPIPPNFFSLVPDVHDHSHGHQHRPVSVATEFVDTDWDAISDVQDNSPRISLQSVSLQPLPLPLPLPLTKDSLLLPLNLAKDSRPLLNPSKDSRPLTSSQSGQTTVDSYDEALTPRSSHHPDSPKQTQGPSGPHLFRTWSDPIDHHAALTADDGLILGMSPMTPKPRSNHHSCYHPPLPHRDRSPFRYTRERLDPSTLALWTREMVAQSMLDAGIDMSMAHRFIENDINGQILLTLKFEDLRELDMPSFGMRTRVWNQIQALLRQGHHQHHHHHHSHNHHYDNRADTFRSPTPIEEAPSREVRREARKQGRYEAEPGIVRCDDAVTADISRHKRQNLSSSGGRTKGRFRIQQGEPDAVIMPSDSVSIIGIEQVIPKPHHCSKGENCGKWKKQQRLIADFRRLYPNVDMHGSGAVVILGDATNPETAPAIDLDAFAEADAFVDVLAGGDASMNGDDNDNNDTLNSNAAAASRDSDVLGHYDNDNNDDDMSLQRPFSDAAPSLVATSDVLGTAGMPPLQYLPRTALGRGGDGGAGGGGVAHGAACGTQARAPQDNVRRFLSFQHAAAGDSHGNEVPPTPPFELVPAATAAQQRRQQHNLPQQQQPHSRLGHLPKLFIPLDAHVPVQHSAVSAVSLGNTTLQQQQQQQPIHQRSYSHDFVPYRMDKVDPRSPDLETPHQRHPCRLGTPFSELDVPVTAVSLGPVSRDASQSVPPDMAYRTTSPVYRGGQGWHQYQQQQQQQQQQQPPRSMSRASARKPMFSLLPSVNEHGAVHTSPHDAKSSSSSLSSTTSSPPPPPPSSSSSAHAASRGVRQDVSSPLQAPPRGLYPWSSSTSSSSSSFLSGLTKTATASGRPPKSSSSSSSSSSSLLSSMAGVSFHGPMKKRKTRLLRHDWHEAYFTLRGTRLNMHKDAATADRTLEYIDIDDYAIACSSLASTSKLSAALKAVRLSSGAQGGRDKGGGADPVAAFSFQLIPQDGGAAARRLRRRDSLLGGGGGGGEQGEAVNGTGKTHHFAVRSRDERIDWMREMMLAKALKQKGDGYEISVNGNMI